MMAIAIDRPEIEHDSATPPRILLHGVAGVGKTTFAAAAPASVFRLHRRWSRHPGSDALPAGQRRSMR